MKQLLVLLLLVAAALSAQAQTNIQVRVQIDGVNSNLNLDAAGSKKDVARIAGIVFAYDAYKASLAEGATPLALGPWLLGQHTILIDNYKDQKQAKDNAVIAEKLLKLLTTNTDLLSNADLNNLATIAAKLP